MYKHLIKDLTKAIVGLGVSIAVVIVLCHHSEIIELLKNYLSCVEYGIDNFSAHTFFNNMFNAAVPINEHISLAAIMPFLPDVNHFVQNGDKCRNNCDIDCFYCNGCARRLQEFISYA